MVAHTVSPTPRRLRWEDHKLEGSLNNTVRPCL